MAQKYASFAAKDTREAGSLPTDFDATLTALQFTKEPPDGYTAEGNPVFANITLLIDEAGDYKDKTENERTLIQSYSLGAKAGDEFTISDDGYGLIPSDDSVTSIRKGTKFDLWKCSLENEGVPQTITEQGNLSLFIGIRGHFRRVDDEKLLGKKREFGDDKKSKSKFPPQTLVLVKLHALPGEKGKTSAPATKTSAPAASTAPAAPAVEGDLDTQTGAYLVQVLQAAKDNTVQRSQLIALLSKMAIKAPNRQDIARRGSDEEFLKFVSEAGIVVGENVFTVAYDPAAKPQVVKLTASA